MSKPFVARIRLVVAFTMLLGGMSAAQAQVTNLLLHYTNTWRYLDTGADPGADWAQPAFNDSAWPAGPGPLGFDTRPPYPYPLAAQTPLTIGVPATPAHFLRTHFTVTNFPPGMDLVARCYFDDAAVLFLNGVEVARWFVPSNQTFQTYSQQSSFFEGSNYVFLLPTNLVVAGDNVLAVEVHQNYDISSDVFWALKLQSIAPTPLVITRQPDNVVTNLGAQFVFDAKVEGGPAWFSWLRNNLILTPWSKSSAWVSSVTANSPTNYQLIATNVLGAVTSSVATLKVVPAEPVVLETVPPVLKEALVQIHSETGVSNAIMLRFSERLNPSTTALTNNYSVVDLDSGASVEVFKADLNNNLVRLKVAGLNWVIGRRYQVTVNRIQDLAGNVIATNSQIRSGVVTVRLISADAVWHYHSAYLADPAIVDSNWTLPDYPEDEFWLRAPGPFGQLLTRTPCLAAIQTTLQNQAHPSLFRMPFLWPAEAGSQATLQISNMVDRGFCLFLNGTEIYRSNLLQTAETPVSSDTHGVGSPTSLLSYFCYSRTVVVSNLVAGTNRLAAAVFPPYFLNTPADQTNSIAFGLTVTLNYPPAGWGAEPPRSNLTVSRQPPGSVVFTWAGTNGILQRTISLLTNAIWSDVTPPTNSPVILPADGTSGFFRLKQP